MSAPDFSPSELLVSFREGLLSDFFDKQTHPCTSLLFEDEFIIILAKGLETHGLILI